jgi:hypothetical protein
MLYYPDDTIQHAGVVIGMGGVAGHAFKTLPARIARLLRPPAGEPQRQRRDRCRHAVATRGLRAARWARRGGLAVAFNDVDLCLRAQALGLRNLWTPWAELYHHESKSRGDDFALEKRERFEAECALMAARWVEAIRHDPATARTTCAKRAASALAAPAAASQRESAATSRTLCIGTDMKLFSPRKPIADQINVLELDPVEAAVAAPALHVHVDVAYHLESQLIVVGWASPGLTVALAQEQRTLDGPLHSASRGRMLPPTSGWPRAPASASCSSSRRRRARPAPAVQWRNAEGRAARAR